MASSSVFSIFAVNWLDFLIESLVVDNDVTEVTIWYIELILAVDLPVEWISKWVVVIDVEFTGTDLGVNFFLRVTTMVLGDVHVELVGLTTDLALGEEETGWDAPVSLAGVHLESAGHDVVVQVTVAGPVGDEEALAGVALDDVQAGVEWVGEAVDLDEVDAVGVDLDFASVLVVLGADEDLDESLGWALGLHLDLVVEGLVVETVLVGADLEGVLVEFFFVDDNGVAEVGVEAVEVGDELVDLDVLDFNAFEVELLVAVLWLVGLVLVEVAEDAGVHLVEHGVAEGSFEVFEDGWCDLVHIEWVVRVA